MFSRIASFSRDAVRAAGITVARTLAAAVVCGSLSPMALADPATRSTVPTSKTPARDHRPNTVRRQDAPGYQWQAMGRDNTHNAYENDPNMNVTVAPSLGVNWMTNLLSSALGGPTVAYNPTLGANVIYTGDESGNVSAINEATGQVLWSTSIGAGDSIYSTPLISSDLSSVWVGTIYNAGWRKLDATTGAIDCTIKSVSQVQGSPTEGFTSSGTPMVYLSATDGPYISGPVLGVQESNCAVLFTSDPYIDPYTGNWASASYGTDANGRNLVFQGTADPDSAEYAIDATTGALDWSYATGLPGDSDIGAAATVSAPGNNGFADGVVYFVDKKQVIYAFDMTTGAMIWENNFAKASGDPGGSARSAAALDGTTLVFGMSTGVFAVNAITGATLWTYKDPASVEVLSNPAIVGPPGQEVVAFGDLAGMFRVLSLATGAPLYQYQTGGYITASPAYVNGHFLIASNDGFLYDFTPGGGNGALPQTTYTAPSPGAILQYSSSVTITGTATDAVGVNAVQVAVQANGSTGPWYNSTLNSWGYGAVTNDVPVASPGSPSTTWSFTVPVPPAGATFSVTANAVNVGGQADRSNARLNFSVPFSTSQAQIQTSAVYIAPGAQVGVTGTGFAPHENVKFALGALALGNANANSSGAIATTLTIVARAPFGAGAISATGQKSHSVAIAPVDIANAWLQNGGNPAQTRFEPNDPVFGAIISPGNNNYLDLAWYFAAGAAVESSPAVYQDTVFFGNDIGTLSAIENSTAVPVWGTTILTSAPIRSTPAIDPSTGNLTFTADDGNVYVVAASTGAAVGTATVGGLPTSPTVGAGTIFVGSDNATLTSLNETTGAVNWSNTMAAAVHATPSLDAAAGIVVGGDDSGAISAFVSSTGAPIWRVMTGGPVTASPAIAGGVVYVGSSDGNLYAINEVTGTPVWTYAAGTAITTGAVCDPLLGNVYAGGANGTIYAVNAQSGTLAYTTVPQRAGHSPNVGFGAAKNELFSETANGSLISYRTSQFGRFNSNHKTAAVLTTSPAVNDGTVYVGANDGGVYAFTTTGAPPTAARGIRLAAAALAAKQRHHAWPAWRSSRAPERDFVWNGQRSVPTHIEAVRLTTPALTDAPPTYHGGPVQTAPRSYLIFWNPGGNALEKRYGPSVVAALKRRASPAIAGAYTETGRLPNPLSDAVLQAEVARAIGTNHWTPNLNAQFVVLTPPGAIPARAGFCSYHSAFSIGRSAPAIYGVVPYSGALSACGPATIVEGTGDPAIDAALNNTVRLQHEFAIDPLLNGWHAANGGETGPGR